jgi:hypothetical protein
VSCVRSPYIVCVTLASDLNARSYLPSSGSLDSCAGINKWRLLDRSTARYIEQVDVRCVVSLPDDFNEWSSDKASE